jgi:RNA polymerase sigma-70 factor, ECF subfamily
VAAVYTACGGEIWRALIVVAGGRSDLAEEATAEAFSRYVVHHERVREPRAWLYRTGFRIVVEELRREKRQGESRELDATAQEHQALSPPLIGALRALTPEQRLCMFLTYHMDLPLGEVAELSGSPVAGVKMRLHRARRALRAQLKEDVGV